jgi:CHAD domain-containing protein
VSSDPSPAAVVRDRVRGLTAQVRDADGIVREGGPEGIHELRVAMRRLRSLLSSFRPLLPPDVVTDTERLRAELRWAAGELSAVRDLEVVHGALFVAAADESLPQSVEARLGRHREEAGQAARRQVVDLLASERYARLLDDLDALPHRVEWGAVTGEAARLRLRKDWRRMRRQAEAADDLAPGADPEVALHEVRKAAKRARYAAETLAPALGGEARRMAEVAEQVQDALGTHRDTLLTRSLLHRLGLEEGADEEHVFGLGRLYAREERRGEESLYDYARAHVEMDRPEHRRWLR